MQAVVGSSTLVGVEAVGVEVQADVSNGLPSFTIVGLADTAVQEARDRVRSALRASGFDFPSRRVLVNLAPAPLKKRGTGFDLAIAASILLATEQIPRGCLEGARVVGELALDGTVRSIPGLLAHAVDAGLAGVRLIGPKAGTDAWVLASDADIRMLEHIRELASGGRQPERQPRDCIADPRVTRHAVDLCDVFGHEMPKRALELSAAGAHNLLMHGPPGSGKSLLARALCGVLPRTTEQERVESATVHSVAGLDERPLLAGGRPFRAPHHSCSTAGLVGGGSPLRPGEASLAHNGVLFLDEMNEFSPSSLQALRQPLEDKSITLVRADGSVTLPAAFVLVGAINPCPCGFLGDERHPCRCSEGQISKHRARIGGPLLDRFDLNVRVDRIDPDLLLSLRSAGECSDEYRFRAEAARDFAMRSRGELHIGLCGDDLLRACRLSGQAAKHLSDTATRTGMSGRGVTRVMRVARTIADLDASDVVRAEHVLESLAFRTASNV